MPTADKEAVTIEPWAAVIGAGTLVLVTAVAIFTAWDHAHTASLETVATPTAVGDEHFVTVPKGGTSSIGIKYHGDLLDIVQESKLRDSRLIQAGMDDSGVYTIYHLDEEKAEKNERLFLKAGDNDFVEVRKE
jgi:hypothetical protein